MKKHAIVAIPDYELFMGKPMVQSTYSSLQQFQTNFVKQRIMDAVSVLLTESFTIETEGLKISVVQSPRVGDFTEYKLTVEAE